MDYRRRLDLNVKDDDLKDISVGDTIEILVKGKVKEVRLGDTPEKPREKAKGDSSPCCGCGIPYSSPSQICIEMDSQKVTAGENKFAALVKERDDDAEEDD